MDGLEGFIAEVVVCDATLLDTDRQRVEGYLAHKWGLEGSLPKPASGTPSAVHFTRGGPWFDNWRDVDYGDLWLAERAALDAAPPA